MWSTLSLKASVRAIAVAASFAVFSWTNVSQARLFELRPLDPNTERRLPEPAREAYRRSLAAVDRINYDDAMDAMNDAVKAAPESYELRFLAIKLAKYKGQMTTGVEATRYLEMAHEHAQAVLAMENLPSRQRQRAQFEADSTDKQRKTVEERDEARRKYGAQIVRAYAKEAYPQKSSSKEIKAFQDAIKSLTSGNASARATSAAAKALSAATAEKAGAAPAAATEGAAPAAEGAAAPAPAPEAAPEAASAPAPAEPPASQDPPPPPPPVTGSAAPSANPFN